MIQYIPGIIVITMCMIALYYVARNTPVEPDIPRPHHMPRDLFGILDTPEQGAQVTLWNWRKPVMPPRHGRYSNGAFYGVSGDVSQWDKIDGDWGWVYG